MIGSVKYELTTLAGGCFWCTEAIMKRLKGIVSVISGFSGGTMANPTYEDIHNSDTGYAESVQIQFDPQIIPYDKVLEIFFAMHDPTTLNRQDNDIGREYRSIIFYHNDKQKEIATKIKSALDRSGKYKRPVVTEIVPFKNFYPAGHEHQNFYDTNPNSPYCRVIIDPKIKKLIDHYREDIKSEYLP